MKYGTGYQGKGLARFKIVSHSWLVTSGKAGVGGSQTNTPPQLREISLISESLQSIALRRKKTKNPLGGGLKTNGLSLGAMKGL